MVPVFNKFSVEQLKFSGLYLRGTTFIKTTMTFFWKKTKALIPFRGSGPLSSSAEADEFPAPWHPSSPGLQGHSAPLTGAFTIHWASNWTPFLVLRIFRPHNALESTLIIWPNTSKIFIFMMSIALLILGPEAYVASSLSPPSYTTSSNNSSALSLAEKGRSLFPQKTLCSPNSTTQPHLSISSFLTDPTHL